MKTNKRTTTNANKTRNDSQIFALQSAYSPAGDQPQAIEKITHSLKQGAKYATAITSHLRPKMIYEK